MLVSDNVFSPHQSRISPTDTNSSKLRSQTFSLLSTADPTCISTEQQQHKTAGQPQPQVFYGRFPRLTLFLNLRITFRNGSQCYCKPCEYDQVQLYATSFRTGSELLPAQTNRAVYARIRDDWKADGEALSDRDLMNTPLGKRTRIDEYDGTPHE